MRAGAQYRTTYNGRIKTFVARYMSTAFYVCSEKGELDFQSMSGVPFHWEDDLAMRHRVWLDNFTRKHLTEWIRREWSTDQERDQGYQALMYWLDSLDDGERAYWINQGWPRCMEVARE